MPKLKDRNKAIPNGFRWIEASTGWEAPRWASFESLVQSLIAHRKGNAWNTKKNNLPTDYQQVAQQVDEFNAQLCVAHHWNDYVLAEATFPKLLPPSQKLSALGAAVGGIKRTVAGIKIVKDWLGSGLKPVDKTLAEQRASICVVCPMNTDPNWLQKLDAKAAGEIKTLVEVRNDLNLSTSHDSRLQSCSACDCYNKLKVWVPLKHIWENTSSETKARLHPKCWVLSEQS